MYRALEAGEPVLVRSYDPVSDFFEDENTEDASRPIDSDLYFQNDALFGEQYIGATDEDDSLVFSDDDSVTSLDLDDQLSLSGEDHKAPTIVFEGDTDFALFEDDTHVIVTTKTWPVYWRNRRLVACAILGCTLLAGLFKLGGCLGNAPVASVQERSFRRANETSLGKSISLASSQYFYLSLFAAGWLRSDPSDPRVSTPLRSVSPLAKSTALTPSHYLYLWLVAPGPSRPSSGPSSRP
mmetsp:Transcript_11626/g.22195  ORF Transcript_11626/g.22195 Transcript_11626/m.22195 type:complete len:239 (-) Transcript_11626:2703-3419(-)